MTRLVEGIVREAVSNWARSVIDKIFLGNCTEGSSQPRARSRGSMSVVAGASLVGPDGTTITPDASLNRFYGAGQGSKGYVIAVGHGVERLGGDFGDEALCVYDVAVEA